MADRGLRTSGTAQIRDVGGKIRSLQASPVENKRWRRQGGSGGNSLRRSCVFRGTRNGPDTPGLRCNPSQHGIGEQRQSEQQWKQAFHERSVRCKKLVLTSRPAPADVFQSINNRLRADRGAVVGAAHMHLGDAQTGGTEDGGVVELGGQVGLELVLIRAQAGGGVEVEIAPAGVKTFVD
jgi:hypothetical protein